MRQLLEQSQDGEQGGLAAALDAELVEDRVYALTPMGEVIDLPQGATPLDFAYHVHTMVGHRCRGAKVNHRIVPLTHKLRSGDRVEILTGKEAAPRRDWLLPANGYLASGRSRDKVRAWFHKLDARATCRPARTCSSANSSAWACSTPTCCRRRKIPCRRHRGVVPPGRAGRCGPQPGRARPA